MKRRKMLKQIGRGGNEEVLCYREGLLFTHNVPGRWSLLDVIIGNIAKIMNYFLNIKTRFISMGGKDWNNEAKSVLDRFEIKLNFN